MFVLELDGWSRAIQQTAAIGDTFETHAQVSNIGSWLAGVPACSARLFSPMGHVGSLVRALKALLIRHVRAPPPGSAPRSVSAH